LQQIIVDVGRATTREDLERILGMPKYALSGAGFEATAHNDEMIIPDRVEVYYRHGCVVDMWFCKGNVCSIVGFVPFTYWDVLAGVPDPHRAEMETQKRGTQKQG
jgi:hypothetical protein